MTEWQDVVEAFADGESVEPDRLKAALANGAARDHLVDVLMLRGLVGAGLSQKPAALAPAMRGPGARWWQWLPAAAVLTFVAVASGYLAGLRDAGPPSMDRPESSHSLSVAPPVSAPAPTQIIKLDWNEPAGGD